MADKVKPLKMESSVLGGTENDPFPTELDPSEDYVSAKGIAFEGNEVAIIDAASGAMSFKDSVVTTAASLDALVNQIKRKEIDLTNLTTGYVLTWDNVDNRFELQAVGALSVNENFRYTFSRANNVTVGSYLNVAGGVVANAGGYFLRGTNKILAVSLTGNTAPATTTRIQICRRTALGVTSDVTGAFVDLPSGQFRAINDNLNIVLSPNDELCCRLESGSTINSPVVGIYLAPA